VDWRLREITQGHTGHFLVSMFQRSRRTEDSTGRTIVGYLTYQSPAVEDFAKFVLKVVFSLYAIY
jgi:hypothetical protein